MAEATARLREQAAARAPSAASAVKVGRRTFVLTTGRLRLRFAEKTTARRALKAKAGRAGAPR